MNQVNQMGSTKTEQRTDIVKKFDQKSSLNIQWTISQCTLYFVPQMPGNTCECGCQGRVAKKGMLKPDHNDRDGVTPDMRRRDAAVRKKWNAQKRRVYANVDGEFNGRAGTHEHKAEDDSENCLTRTSPLCIHFICPLLSCSQSVRQCGWRVRWPGWNA